MWEFKSSEFIKYYSNAKWIRFHPIVNGSEVYDDINNEPKLILYRPPVVLLHGLFSNSKCWEKLRQQLVENYLNESYPNQYVIAPSSTDFVPLR